MSITQLMALTGVSASGGGFDTNFDANFDDVVLLLDGDGTSGSTTFTDKSSSSHTITVNGDTQVDTTVKKFGSGSIEFDGTGDYLSISDSEDFNMGSGDFTAECWAYFDSLSTTEPFIMGQWSGNVGGTTLNWAIMLSTNTGYVRFITSSNGSGVLFDLSTSTTSFSLSTSTWYHIAAVRNGNSFKIFVDGVERASTTNSSALYNATNAFTIGAESDGQQQAMNGYLDDIRITKGVARYSNSFTPPTAALSADVSDITGSDDVVLLLDGDGTIMDKSSSSHTITVNGDTQVDTTVKKFGSGSIEFDGTGDYLTGPTSTDFAFGSGDFTIESWVYFTGFDTLGNSIVDTRQTGNVGILLEGSAAISGQYYFRAYNPTSGHFITSSQALSTNTWYHVALVRNGNNYQIFVNGVSTASVSNSVSLTGQDLTIGASFDYRNNSGIAQFTGHLDDLRITKGAALYPFHPPIDAFPNR